MRLVYNWNNEPVKIGDVVTLSKVEKVKVTYFREPHKPSSQGKVSVQSVDDEGMGREYYVSVIGATWIEREDQ